jgi:hypothetical protein
LATPFASAFGSRWEDQQFPNWDEKLLEKLVSDSPWARTWKGTTYQPVSEKQLISSRWAQLGVGIPSIPGLGAPRIPGTGPAPGRGDTGPAILRVSVELIVRWASALPVRRALALQEFGRDGLGSEKAREMLSEQPAGYVMELAGIPRMLLSPDLERQLRKARLSVPGARSSTPLSVELPTMGLFLTARMTFPRWKDAATGEGAAAFALDMCGLRIQQEFKLRSMLYEGRLEL